MLVVLNVRADSGRAARRWSRIREPLRARVGAFDTFDHPAPAALRRRLTAALRDGERRFVAVGGDGTVNRLMNQLLALAPVGARDLAARDLAVGAVGVGSSNDFHKPRIATSSIAGWSCRVNFDDAPLHDVGRIVYIDADGRRHLRRWLLNASIGTTARGNRVYNEANGLVGAARRVSATLGMTAAALDTLCSDTGQMMHLLTSDRQGSWRVHNLGVVKNPHFTGCLRYDSPYEPASGDFHVHLLADATRWDVVRTLWGLARGRFAGRSVHSWRSRTLTVFAESDFPVECDGEVMLARRVEFSLEPRAIGVCRA